MPISPGHPVTDVSRESCGYLLDIEPLTGRVRAQDIHRIYRDMVAGITAFGQWIGRPRSSIRHWHQVMWTKKRRIEMHSGYYTYDIIRNMQQPE